MTVHQRLTGTTYPLKLSSNEFLALADAGLFEGFARTELIEGEIWTMNAVHRWHARMQTVFMFAVQEALAAIGSDLIVYCTGSVLMSDNSVPEPDISIAKAEPLTREPISLAAVQIAIELSDSTRAMDLDRKAKLYAECGVPEYWVVDREEARIVCHSDPKPAGYARVDSVAFGKVLEAASIAELRVETGMLVA